jgi:hypothetical protein
MYNIAVQAMELTRKGNWVCRSASNENVSYPCTTGVGFSCTMIL